MNEPKPVPDEVKKEAAELETDRLKEQLAEGANVISQLMMKANLDLKLGMRMAAALTEIKNIKGSPPIKVAQTISEKAIDECANMIREHYEQEESNPDSDPVLCGACPIEGAEEHAPEHLPGRASGPGADGEQGADPGDTKKAV